MRARKRTRYPKGLPYICCFRVPESVFPSIFLAVCKAAFLGQRWGIIKALGFWNETDATWRLGRQTASPHVGESLPSLSFLPTTDFQSLSRFLDWVNFFAWISCHSIKRSNTYFHHIISLGAQTVQGDNISICCWSSQPKNKSI